MLERDPVLRRVVEVIVREIDPDKIILFGSRARGDHREDSDYDILVLKEGIRPEDRRKMEAIVERAFYRERIDVEVDVVIQSPLRFHLLKGDRAYIYGDIHREGRVIYEKRSVKVA